jgi:hypothetical protein
MDPNSPGRKGQPNPNPALRMGQLWNRRKSSTDFWRKDSWPAAVYGLHSLTDGHDETKVKDRRESDAAAGQNLAMEHGDGEQKGPVPFLLIASIFLSVFLSAIDISIVATALPTIAERMHAGEKGFTWIGSAYLLSGAASEPIWAKISDIFGRRPILISANIVFLLGSILCALSSTIAGLIAGRVVQGLGSGGILVLANILIGDLFNPR